MKVEWFDCECTYAGHSLRFMVDSTDDDDQPKLYLYINTGLSTGGFWFRLKNALKYIFAGADIGYSETILSDKDDLKRLIRIIQKVEEA